MGECILEVNSEGQGGNRQYVRLPFCWFWPEGWENSCKGLKKISYKFQENVCFLIARFWWQKVAFKSSLELYFHPSIIEFRIEEKIHTKAVVDVSRGTEGRIFLGEIREGVSRNLLSPVTLYQRILKWNLDQNSIMALLIVAVFEVFSFEMFNIQIFKILKMFKYNMKIIRAACWINSKTSNRDKNTILIIFLFSNYCWSLLWCNYWRSLMLRNSTSGSRLKLTFQKKFALYPCDPFLINNRNMTGNSVEK